MKNLIRKILGVWIGETLYINGKEITRKSPNFVAIRDKEGTEKIILINKIENCHVR